MINKPLESILLADIQSLIDNAAQEGKTLEYKRDLPGDSSDDKKKILRALCSLANTAGGDLIYGIAAQDGVPTQIIGIDSTNEDAIRLRLENSSRDNIQPRLPLLDLKFVPVADGLSVMIVRVRKSWNSPHRLAADGHFYGRNSAGAYQLDVGELRQTFTLADNVIDRIRSFRADRLLKVNSNSGPVALADGVKMVFHMVPFSAFSSNPPSRIELSIHQRRVFDPIGSATTTTGVNLDGYYRYSRADADTSKSYVQVFRSGVVELVNSFGPIKETEKPVPAKFIESNLINKVNTYTNALHGAGVDAPFFFFLSFLNIKGSRLLLSGMFSETAELVERNMDALVLQEAMAEVTGFDVAQTLKPIFDSYWNAYGYERSENYDESGQWIV